MRDRRRRFLAHGFSAAWILTNLLTGLSGCVRVAVRPRVDDGPVAERSPLDEEFLGLINEHNRARASAGLEPLTTNDRLMIAAQEHANDMARRRRMSHRGSDGSSPFRRIERAGYSFERAGENVAYGQMSTLALMRDWMRSPGHRRNILGAFREVGAAYATDESGTPYWCVTFGNPKRP